MIKTKISLLLFFFWSSNVMTNAQPTFKIVPGKWNSSTGNKFEMKLTDKGIRISNLKDAASWALFDEVKPNEFICREVDGNFYKQNFKESKITVINANNLSLLNNIDGKTYYWNRPLLNGLKRTYTVSPDGEVMQNGTKIAKVKKTSNGNFLSGTVAEFTVYDVNNTPCLLFEGENGKFILLDDNKSFIPRQCDAHIDGDFGIAQFISNEDILTPEGFNKDYRAFFIRKFQGIDAMSAGNNSRDKSEPVRLKDNDIYQGNTIIGSAEYYNSDDYNKVNVKNLSGKIVAILVMDKPDRYNMVSINVYLKENTDSAKKWENLSYLPNGHMFDMPVRWLIDNNIL